jgi:DNA-binding response OmpR family regulator
MGTGAMTTNYPIISSKKGFNDRPSILLIADDLEMGQHWDAIFSLYGWHTTVSATGDGPVQCEKDRYCDLVLICTTHPDKVDEPFIEGIRRGRHMPVILDTYGTEQTAIKAYQAGVDECVLEPISPTLLVAKIRVWLRHAPSAPAGLLGNPATGKFRLDTLNERVLIGERPVQLSQLEFRLLHLLMTNAGRTLPPEAILQKVWGLDEHGDPALVKNLVYRLRLKIEVEPTRPRHIRTVAGAGYRFEVHTAPLNN